MGEFLRDVSKIFAVLIVFIMYVFSLRLGSIITTIFFLILIILIPYTYFRLVSRGWEEKNLAE